MIEKVEDQYDRHTTNQLSEEKSTAVTCVLSLFVDIPALLADMHVVFSWGTTIVLTVL